MADMKFLPQLCLQLVGKFRLGSDRIECSTHQFISDAVLVCTHKIVIRYTEGKEHISMFIDGHFYK